MRDTINLILQGCKQARDIEVSLQNPAIQPRLLSQSCEDIINIFSAAKQRIDQLPSSSSSYHFFNEQQQSQILKYLLHQGLGPGILIPQPTNMAGPSSGSRSAGLWIEGPDPGADITVAGEFRGSSIADLSQSQERVPSTSSQRQRRRYVYMRPT